ncbi:MAG: ACT domain-containing protein [Pseudomonadota bacterium]
MSPVRDKDQMIAQMAPKLDGRIWHFCTLSAPGPIADRALAWFEEDEGCSFILPDDVVRQEGFPDGQPMARITLRVQSALDGVGLTAAVAGVLAEAGIPCNMVAAYHHDHAFVPWARRDEAMTLLHALSDRGAA